MMNSQDENPVVQSTIKWLELHKFFVSRLHNRAIKRKDKSGGEFWVFHGTPGIPDIFAIRDGLHLWVECKTKKGKQSPSQKEWQLKLEQEKGVYVLVVDPVEDLKEWISIS